jgi:GH25 family lysozyme M1 (1,4-beta-N-acetylmuramidase)
MGMGDNAGSTNDSQAAPDGRQKVTVAPGSTVVYGIDVSYYQGSPNWSSVKASGKKFAFIRFSDGTTYLDPNFSANWKAAVSAGLTVGAYQFFRPNQDATAQADLLANKLIAMGVTGRPFLPAVIDVEVTGGMSAATVLARVNTWLARIQSRTGCQPILYTSPGFWNGIGAPTPSPLPYLWVANWGVSAPNLPSPWGRLRFWQYSATGSVSGISGSVDMDLYNGSLSEMQSLASGSSYVTGTVHASPSLNIRSGPGSSYSIVGSLANGATVKIHTQTYGTSVTGTYGTTAIWNHIDGGYVSDAYIYTASSGLVMPLE